VLILDTSFISIPFLWLSILESPLHSLPSTLQVDGYKQCSYNACNLSKDCKIIDVGCGVGTDALSMLKVIGEGGEGKVVGIDRSQALLDEATKYVHAHLEGKETLKHKVEFITGDVYQLPFDDNYFDASRTDRVLQHLDDPLAAVKEMVGHSIFDYAASKLFNC